MNNSGKSAFFSKIVGVFSSEGCFFFFEPAMRTVTGTLHPNFEGIVEFSAMSMVGYPMNRSERFKIVIINHKILSLDHQQ